MLGFCVHCHPVSTRSFTLDSAKDRSHIVLCSGKTVGENVGARVGLLDVGAHVGGEVGELEGCTEGKYVGCPVGKLVGYPLGCVGNDVG